jgi:pimeloyl-ACP methyl ester carboxylesterase
VRLHVLDRGQGPAVVLLHGDGSMIQDFVASGIVDQLAERHRVIVFDRPGYGYSQRPRKRLWTAQAQADLFHAALKKLGVERPIVVGHSWGTLPAIDLALQHPDDVQALVLLSGHYYPKLRLDAALMSPPALPVIGDAMRYTISPVLGRLMARKIIAMLFAPAPIPAHFDRGFPVEMALRPSQIRAAAEESGLLLPINANDQTRYSALKLPVAILAGRDDRLVDTHGQSLRLHEELPQSTFQMPRSVGHMIHQTMPDVVVAAIENVGSTGRILHDAGER